MMRFGSGYRRLRGLRRLGLLALGILGCVLGNGADPLGVGSAPTGEEGAVTLESADHSWQFRLFTNASPEVPRPFNTFEVRTPEECLWPAPTRSAMPQAGRHHFLVDSRDPELKVGSGAEVIDRRQASGWQYVGLDLTGPYRDQLREYRRGLLLIEPDLLVIHDHLVAEKPVAFEMVLPAPDSVQLDPTWGHLHLETAQYGLALHAPGTAKNPRNWRRTPVGATEKASGTVLITRAPEPNQKLAELDFLTVLVVSPRKSAPAVTMKLLESNSAVGARIYRQGLPTLVAFRLQTPGATASTGTNANASIAGFEFNGPVGVSPFPKRRNTAR